MYPISTKLMNFRTYQKFIFTFHSLPNRITFMQVTTLFIPRLQRSKLWLQAKIDSQKMFIIFLFRLFASQQNIEITFYMWVFTKPKVSRIFLILETVCVSLCLFENVRFFCVYAVFPTFHFSTSFSLYIVQTHFGV